MEVERQHYKLGLQQFLVHRGIGSNKPVAIVRLILESSKKEIFCYLGHFKQTVLVRATQLVSLKNNQIINKQYYNTVIYLLRITISLYSLQSF